MQALHRWFAAAWCVGGLCAGCNSSTGSSAEDFYVPPDPLPSSVPGTLIRAEEIEPFAEGTRAWRVLYVSRAVDDTPIAVSGMVAAPAGPAPEAGYDVVTWSHGTTGISDSCAPSRGYRTGYHDFYDIAPELVAAGYVGVSTDYEGLGTPGAHPYLVGPSEGRGVLDIEGRAANRRGGGGKQGGHLGSFAGWTWCAFRGRNLADLGS